jgi:hypothetical protein
MVHQFRLGRRGVFRIGLNRDFGPQAITPHADGLASDALRTVSA